MNTKIVCVVGQGYVGLPLAKAAVDAGYRVVGLDTDTDKVDNLNRGRSPIEDVTNEDLKAMIGVGNYTAVPDASEVRSVYGDYPDIWVVTVPTPLKDGRPDTSMVWNAGFVIGPYVIPGALVILESTVAPGTTEGEFYKALAMQRGKLGNFHLAYSPERIDPGNQRFNFTNTPKLVAGTDLPSFEVAANFYENMIGGHNVVPVDTIEAAETAKLLENTFRHVNIALVNELAQHCDRLGINVWDVIEAAATKPYGFMPFYPGPGVGGHCLPVDPEYLGDKVKALTGQPFHFVDLAMRINQAQPAYVVQRIMRVLNDEKKAVSQSKILLLGYAYKPNTSDARETPAEAIYDDLLQLGADVDVLDPHVPAADFLKKMPGNIKLAEYDMIALLTAHDAFAPTYQFLVDSGLPILDTRNVFPAAANVHKL